MPTQQEIDAQRSATAAVAKPGATTAATASPKAVSTTVTPTMASATVDAKGQASPVGRALTGVPTGYNPYTKGTETINPTVGVNTRQYSVEERPSWPSPRGTSSDRTR